MPSTQRKPKIYQLKITLKRIKPPIWRRILVESDTTLEKLHSIIQIAMGWMDGHLHQFIAGEKTYGEPHEDNTFEVIDERRVRLSQVVKREKARFVYEYDFGDGWQHEILVEKISAPEPDQVYPICVKGKRSCPPEDVGGPWGYANFLEAIENEDHPEHEDYLDWIDGSFDPEEFDLEAVNASLV
jgi:hypothetical protein